MQGTEPNRGHRRQRHIYIYENVGSRGLFLSPWNRSFPSKGIIALARTCHFVSFNVAAYVAKGAMRRHCVYICKFTGSGRRVKQKAGRVPFGLEDKATVLNKCRIVSYSCVEQGLRAALRKRMLMGTWWLWAVRRVMTHIHVVVEMRYPVGSSLTM